jgi:putative endonuclease
VKTGAGDGDTNLKTGRRGEELAAEYLVRRGCRILDRNYRCKGGEVDIVAREGTTLVFVEVKTRRSHAFGLPQHAVTLFKQRQIAKAALTWLSAHRKQNSMSRFDVVAITLRENADPLIEHLENAFDLNY